MRLQFVTECLEDAEQLRRVPLTSTLLDLAGEIVRARTKFPKSDGLIAALLEEVGEAADAIRKGGAWRKELLQVACVAIRLIEEGDPLADETLVRVLLAEASEIEGSARVVLAKLCGDDAAARSEVSS